MNRGRPRKEVFDPLTMRKLAIEKHEHGDICTYEETALALWNPELESKPMSAMGICKIEQKALAKLRAVLGKDGIKSLGDMLESRHQQTAKIRVVSN